jgi:hypothetical protein
MKFLFDYFQHKHNTDDICNRTIKNLLPMNGTQVNLKRVDRSALRQGLENQTVSKKCIS